MYAMSSMPPIRLYTDQPLAAGVLLSPEEKQAHYLLHVRRVEEGMPVALFNGKDGEWVGTIEQPSRKQVQLRVTSPLRPQASEPDVWLLFAPLKHGSIDYLAEKATELGASRLIPVRTQRTIVTRVNQERLLANAIEAAQQSERLTIPQVDEIISLPQMLTQLAGRPLLFCDETGQGKPIHSVLSTLAPHTPLAVLIGPEGGFTPEERHTISTLPEALPAGLGPRVLRADTAAVASLACVQALLGHWNSMPAFRTEL